MKPTTPLLIALILCLTITPALAQNVSLQIYTTPVNGTDRIAAVSINNGPLQTCIDGTCDIELNEMWTAGLTDDQLDEISETIEDTIETMFLMTYSDSGTINESVMESIVNREIHALSTDELKPFIMNTVVKKQSEYITLVNLTAELQARVAGSDAQVQTQQITINTLTARVEEVKDERDEATALMAVLFVCLFGPPMHKKYQKYQEEKRG